MLVFVEVLVLVLTLVFVLVLVLVLVLVDVLVLLVLVFTVVVVSLEPSSCPYTIIGIVKNTNIAILKITIRINDLSKESIVPPWV